MILGKFFARYPAAARVLPFVIFVCFTSSQGIFGPDSAFWIYLIKTILGLWLILEMRPYLPEMRWAFSWLSVVVGLLVLVVWVGVTGWWSTQIGLWAKLHLTHGAASPTLVWNPIARFGPGLGYFFVIVRIVGSTLIVPPIEEAFYRSFLYRYLATQNFLSIPLNKFIPFPFVAAAIIFGFSHNEWFAGIFCGLAYQWLVLRTNRLGEAMTAHAITNLLLGVWVVWQNAWNFW